MQIGDTIHTPRFLTVTIKELDVGQNCDQDVFNHVHKAMHDYNMSLSESDRWAWLNTLFGYDIGADRALDLDNWYYENGMDVLEIEADDRETVKNICELELGLHLNFSG